MAAIDEAAGETWHQSVEAASGVLVLDVGRAWRNFSRSNACHPEDRQRSGAPVKSFGACPRRVIMPK